ncbi:efflux RND transporter periplasmic adaptor subunit [Rhodobacter calidifons]|uniref:Efflux RND transporter periplasmic adaptor subunit n=1 Tax=Rhodobacter calidifons TaxID=2715277 RepID=A0ABX0G4C7_9RHOB|nr:efflux RND transporter periplasmic adaptor subunit [Rhodobacter calidifons]NHB76075.1 efflux RND transporter periplasmic adaptor subunit [Rhodobacter calidifons]
MPKFHRIAALCVTVAAGAWIATGEFSSVGSAQTAEGKESPTPVSATAEKAPLVRTVSAVVPGFVDHARAIRLSGVTQADKRVDLAARTEGIIASLAMAKGGSVEAGAVVMELEGPETVAQEKIAEIALAQKERDLEVAQRLFDSGSTTESALTNARSARDAAAAELARAQAAADRLRLKAPFAGIVDSLSVEPGEWVQTGAPVATILSLDPIVVRAEVSEVDLGAVVVGSTARVRLVNGAEMDGTVRLVAREASAQTRTFPVEIALPNPGLALSAGMTAEVSLFAPPVRAVVVPRSVITLSDKGEIGLRVVGQDNRARFAAIQIIDDTPEGLVVTGVQEGVRIITAGQDLVRDGDKVDVAPGVGQ